MRCARVVLVGLFALFVSACGGGGSGASVPTGALVAWTPSQPSQMTFAGNVSNLASGGSLVLTINGASPQTITGSGVFSFAVPAAAGGSYSVAVSSQPAGQVCSAVLGGTAADGAQTLSVNCVPSSYAVSGTVSNLASGTQVVLSDNGSFDSVTVAASGSFSFSKPVALNGAYAVTVATDPPGQTCTVNNGSGTGVAAAVSNVSVICSNLADTVSGTVTGLPAGDRVVLEDNGDATDLATVTVDGNFQFSKPVANGAAYDVTIASHSPVAGCSVTNGSGTAAGTNITTVQVTCGVPKQTTLYSFGGPGLPSATNPIPFSPTGQLVSDGAGNFYGVAKCGGTNLTGVIYKISQVGSTWAETTLYSFPAIPNLTVNSNCNGWGTSGSGIANGPAIGMPVALTLSNGGMLYGFGVTGGTNALGGVFQFDIATGAESVLAYAPAMSTVSACGNGSVTDYGWWSFGSWVYPLLSSSTNGNLFLVSTGGGIGQSGTGDGIAVEINEKTGAVTTLFDNFWCGSGSPGTGPVGAYADSSGNLYSAVGAGLFEIPAGGGSPILISADSGFSAGWWPGDYVGIGAVGNVIYVNSSSLVAAIPTSGGAPLYSYAPANSIFTASGAVASGTPMVDSQGNLYGVMTYGGLDNTGLIFRITPSGQESAIFPTFGDPYGGTNGINPFDAYLDATGDMYVLTGSGGAYGNGALVLVR